MFCVTLCNPTTPDDPKFQYIAHRLISFLIDLRKGAVLMSMFMYLSFNLLSDLNALCFLTGRCMIFSNSCGVSPNFLITYSLSDCNWAGSYKGFSNSNN